MSYKRQNWLSRLRWDTPDSGSSAGSDSIMDIFSMEFEGQENTNTATTSDETPIVSDPQPASTETPAQQTEPTPPSSDEAPSVETGDVEQVTAPAPTKPEVPQTEKLLADALKAINVLSEKAAQKPDGNNRPIEKSVSAEDEDEDAKVFAPRKFSDYTFNISPKLYNGLFNPDASEEERVNSLQGFASGIATTVHNKILESLGSWTKENFQAVPRAIDYMLAARERQQGSIKNIREDFYGAFPDLNKAEFGPLVKATIQAVQKETGAKEWNATFRNAVGNRIRSLLSAYANIGKPAPVAPKATPASTVPSVAKPITVDPNSSDAILDVFKSEF